MTPTAPTRPPRALERPPGLAVAARAGVMLVVLMLALLQSLGPFLHAHARATHGGDGLHLHLVAAGQIAAVVDDGRHPAQALPMAAPDDGSAVFLSTEYRREVDLAPVLMAATVAPLRPVPERDAAGEGREALRWPAAAAQAPPLAVRHRLPLSTAPPIA